MLSWLEIEVCSNNLKLFAFCLDQILIGALNGDVVIVDPGKDVESRNEVSVLIEKRLPHPVLQILVGRFLASYDENLLAILHPKTLAFYRLNSGKFLRVSEVLFLTTF